MRICIVFLFVVVASSGIAQSDSVLLSGTLLDTYSNKPIENVEVVLSIGYGSQRLSTKSNKKGEFQFRSIKEDSYHLIVADEAFIEKQMFVRDTNDVIHVDLKLRSRTETLTSQDVDSTILNSKVKRIFKKYNLEMNDINEIIEPIGIHRGFEFELADSAIVFVFIDRMVMGRDYTKALKRQKVVGLGISMPDGTIQYYGSGKPYAIRFNNKYHIGKVEAEE